MDVFFVISGYLISGIIGAESASGRFDFRAFYLRRVRRLAPSLLVVLFATVAAGTLVLVPADLDDLARSAVSVLLLASIGYFEANTGYFDGSAATKVLLHTWSLSVEGQFYLVWPLLLVALGRNRVWVLLCAGLASLAPAVADPWSPLSGFCSPLSRGLRVRTRCGSRAGAPAIAPRGCKASIFHCRPCTHQHWCRNDSGGQAYPSAVALIPALGAALLTAGGPGTWVGAAL